MKCGEMGMINSVWAMLWILFLNVAANALAAPYSMQDLQALEAAGAHKEFLDHALDIRPSQRDKNWEEMLYRMAEKFLEQLDSQTQIDQDNFKQLSKVSAWPALMTHLSYQPKRDRIALKYFRQCANREDDFSSCHQQALDYFNAFQKNKDLGIQLAQLFHPLLQKAKERAQCSKQCQEIDLWSFAAPMANSPIGEFYCGKSPLFDILNSKHLQDNINSQELALHQDCLKTFKSELIAQLSRSGLHRRSSAFKVLSKLDALTPKQTHRHHFLQLMSGSVSADREWEKAFDALIYLGEHSEVREEIMLEFKQMPLLMQDKFFSSINDKRGQVVLKHLHKNFPEFVSLYQNTCFDWLEGKHTFTQGNPTPHCHEYFKALEKISSHSNAHATKRYHAIINDWKNQQDKPKRL